VGISDDGRPVPRAPAPVRPTPLRAYPPLHMPLTRPQLLLRAWTH
jgi:hypothetical protein